MGSSPVTSAKKLIQSSIFLNLNMKKFITTLFCLFLVGCSQTYNVITNENLNKSKENVVKIANDYGYTVNLVGVKDTVMYGVVNSQLWHYYWSIEEYMFMSDCDTFLVDLSCRNRCVTEAQTIPYIDMLTIGCNGSDDICDTIRYTFENTPNTKIKTITDGALSGLLVGGAILPFLMIIGYATIYNVR